MISGTHKAIERESLFAIAFLKKLHCGANVKMIRNSETEVSFQLNFLSDDKTPNLSMRSRSTWKSSSDDILSLILFKYPVKILFIFFMLIKQLDTNPAERKLTKYFHNQT